MPDRSTERQSALSGKAVRRENDVVGRERAIKGRDAHDLDAAGSQKIVDGLRYALRARQNIHVSRKDIAQFAGVTPALITYYFPEKHNLIEAATFPIICAMVDGVEECLAGAGSSREKLLEVIDLLIGTYAQDGPIIDLYAFYQSSKADFLPNMLSRMKIALETFFDQWLKQNKNSRYDAAYLQEAAIGMCKIVARSQNPAAAHEPRCGAPQLTQAEAICSILLNPMSMDVTTEPSVADHDAKTSVRVLGDIML